MPTYDRCPILFSSKASFVSSWILYGIADGEVWSVIDGYCSDDHFLPHGRLRIKFCICIVNDLPTLAQCPSSTCCIVIIFPINEQSKMVVNGVDY